MVAKEFSEACAEFNKILNYLPDEYVEKIPKKLRSFFLEVQSGDYISNIDPYKQIDEQNLLPETEILLTIIYRNYWCTEEERTQLDKILIENDRKYEEELKEKYNPDIIFKKKDNEERIKKVEETNLAVYDNRVWYQKAFEFISSIFNKIF